ncbi:beta strand repeat-containing protein, partial [Haemophilus influenzae]
ANLTIYSGDWVDVHKNITLGSGFLNITAKSVAFEGKGTGKSRVAASAQITAQGTININGKGRDFRLNNVSLNGTGNGLRFLSVAGNHTHKLDGEINISGKVEINQTAPHTTKFWQFSNDSYWNVSTLNLNQNANFTFIKFTNSNSFGNANRQSSGGVIFNGLNSNMSFNIARNASVLFRLKSSENINKSKPLPHQFKANITATGGGSIFFDIYANRSGRGANLIMSTINVSNGTNLTLNSHVRGDNAFQINKDLTINASGSFFNLEQRQDKYTDGYPNKAISSTKNLTILGGNVTLGGQNSSSSITGNITIKKTANVTLEAHNGFASNQQGDRAINLGNLTVEGELSLVGTNANISGDLSVKENAKFKGKTQDNLNITGNFTNNGTAEINISQGAVNLGNVTNDGNLNITTRAKNSQKSIIRGDITNNKGNLNITNNGSDTEIQIGGNISQKEGNLTISSDKVNITKHITIKAGVKEGNSDSSEAENANLTIKTKELKLAGDLNISGFNKAEITAKDNSDLTIGKASGGDGDAKKVTFDKVKDSKISANGHKVTLNSKVETSNGNSDAAGDSNGNNAGLTISAKDVAVNNNITSHKTVSISASEGNITTKAGTTINATTGSVEVTAKTGDIKGGIESKSGGVTLTATGDTLAVGNISGNTVSVTANSGTLTTKADSTIKGTGSVTTLSQSGDISGTISGNTVSVSATGDLTTKSGSKIEAKSGEANVTSATGTIGGTISGNTVSVSATGDLTTKSGSKIEAKSGEANITSATGTIGGTISGGTVNITANTGGLTIGSSAKV